MRRIAWAALGLAAAVAARAEVPAAVALPEGIADARGQLGVFRAAAGGVVAVELSTGAVRWSSGEGEWPLHADAQAVAVAAIDPAEPGALRIRFLAASDGRRLRESSPVFLPKGLAIPDPRKAPGPSTPRFAVRGWTQGLSRRGEGRDARLRVRWEWSSAPDAGPAGARRATEVVLVDAETGEVALAGASEAPPVPAPALPAAFQPEPGHAYWRAGPQGGAWSDAPTPFSIAYGMEGALATDRGGRRLKLLRWRAGEPPTTLELASGAEYAPTLAIGGRFVAVSERREGTERVLLFDLAQTPAVAMAELPAFGAQCTPPFAVAADRVLCVHEGAVAGGGTAPSREVVALPIRVGDLAWSVPVGPPLREPTASGGR
jgi:hypothetical protein